MWEFTFGGEWESEQQLGVGSNLRIGQIGGHQVGSDGIRVIVVVRVNVVIEVVIRVVWPCFA